MNRDRHTTHPTEPVTIAGIPQDPPPQPSARPPKKGRARRLVAVLLFAAGVSLAGYGVWLSRPPAAPAPPVPPSPPESSGETPAQPNTSLPTPLPPVEITQPELVGKLFTTQERLDYRSGEMTLQIPRMGVDVAVQQSTSEADLAVGVGLFDYAQLPGEGNRNVSIAGHRDIKGCEFYYIDRLTPGDLIYLTYRGQVYTYQYKNTSIITPDNWGPITSQGYSCITLLSCWPLGTTRERVVVVGQLIKTEPWAEDYFYAPTTGILKVPAWDDSAETFEQWPINHPEYTAPQQDAAPPAELTGNAPDIPLP